MKFWFAFVVNALAIVCHRTVPTEGGETAADDCPHICPRIYRPVCAAAKNTAGESLIYKYFPNECLMHYDNCHGGGKAWTTTRTSLCLPHVDPLLRTECERPCPYNYLPVCATNGRVHEIFDNDCLLRLENCLGNGEWITTEDRHCAL